MRLDQICKAQYENSNRIGIICSTCFLFFIAILIIALTKRS
jgi:hypothetical protein